MQNFAMRSMILAACLSAVACTDEQASTPEGAPAVAANPAVAAPEASPAPTLTARTASLEGFADVPLCALDSVNETLAADGTFPASAGQPITFDGWVATSNLKNPGSIKIILDGQSDFEIGHVTGVPRKDVADAYKSAELENAGFKTQLPSLDIPADRYSVLLGHDEAGAAVLCKTNLTLIVSQ